MRGSKVRFPLANSVNRKTSAPEGFRGHPQVLNGASDLVSEIFGERGQHTRLALGINEMPLDAAVQLAMTAEVAD